jgi:hypothetical protein
MLSIAKTEVPVIPPKSATAPLVVAPAAPLLSKVEPSQPPKGKPTIAEVARAVPQGAALQVAESKLESLRAEREKIGSEITCACAKLQKRGGTQPTDAIKVLEAQKALIEGQIKEARVAAVELRLARSRKVAAALGARRLDAARRLIAATDEQDKAFAELTEACEEIRRAGDAEQPRFYAPAVGHIWNHAQSIVRAAE